MQWTAVETRERLQVCYTVKECINSHLKYRFKTPQSTLSPCIKSKTEQLSYYSLFMWVAESFPVCALQLIKWRAKDFIIVIDTISEDRGGSSPLAPS